VRSPQFDGITFHEVLCKSAEQSAGRGACHSATPSTLPRCSHAAAIVSRAHSRILDFDPGDDFDTQVVVKTNVAEILRRELRRPSWTRETSRSHQHDPYQRAEGRYALMPASSVRSRNRERRCQS